MTRRVHSAGVALALVLLGPPAGGGLSAQEPAPAGIGTVVRGGAIYQSYVLGSGLAFDRITQLVVPVTVSQRFGPRLTVDLAGGFATASVRTLGGSLDHAGAVDTDLRAAVALVPGRVVLTVVGTLPTGSETVPDTTLPLYGATATDLLGFMAPAFGGGGALTAGVAAAFPLSPTWAVGAGASYRHSGSYLPVAGGEELSPGGEGRVRVGVEGSPGGAAYLRAALVYVSSARDRFAGGTEAAIGDRVLVHAALNLPLGRGALSVYGWEMRRLKPRGLTSATVATPRGNALALGARWDRPLSPTVGLAPVLEFRHELSGYQSLDLVGYLVRPGADLRWRLSDRAALVLQAHLALGRVRDDGNTVSLRGPRVGALLEWTR
ncbi:MAG TPA: hypothetical protein VNI61_00735 [Gemmatimonadales bacterium]|nr:hypothetical protein [Gemmatimonadales bacterium]